MPKYLKISSQKFYGCSFLFIVLLLFCLLLAQIVYNLSEVKTMSIVLDDEFMNQIARNIKSGEPHLTLKERELSSFSLTSEEAAQTISFFQPVQFLGKMLPVEVNGTFGVQLGRNPIVLHFSLKKEKVIYYLENNENIYQGGNSKEFENFLNELTLKKKESYQNDFSQINDFSENDDFSKTMNNP